MQREEKQSSAHNDYKNTGSDKSNQSCCSSKADNTRLWCYYPGWCERYTGALEQRRSVGNARSKHWCIFHPFVRVQTTHPQDYMRKIGWSDVEVTIQHLPSLCSFFDDVPARWCAKDKRKHRSDNTRDKSMRTTDQHRNMLNPWQQVPSETARNEQSAHKNKRDSESAQLDCYTDKEGQKVSHNPWQDSWITK